MEKFSALIERIFMPIAQKLNTIKGLVAVRDGFLQLFPLTLAGSLVVMINVVFLSSDGFVGQYLVKVLPNLNNLQAILSPILNGTIDIMAIFAAFLIARNMANQYNADGTKAGITAIAAFFVLYPPRIDGNVPGSFLGANGIFVAIIAGLFVGYAFAKLTEIDALKIKMPETVPPEVMKSFMVAIPTIIILISTSIIAYIVAFVEPEGINVLIYSVLKKPVETIGATVWTPLVLIFIAMILWSFGIHGTSTVSPIYISIYSAMNLQNIAYAAQAGTTAGSPYPFTWFVLFENYGCIGGTGNTLALIVAILILSRRKNWVRSDYTTIAKLALVPGLFCINEPIIFGLPIVLNPIMVIPFILSPIISMALGAFMISIGFASPGTLDVGWTTPQPLKAFLSASGSWQTALSVCIVFVICVAIYLPFVAMANKSAQKESV
ncbi:PTS lactose transporter subunit IIC [Erysipelothrix larvae]|uniref:Permease IIC component n=1 Tax=Erysipelothrix larvae TaxID=1514105 RepID=A0A109UHJ9_9FIRM|nr:PTS transporter subunit EIIC [Erysipelothrix larvae]AMC94350.1 PTS lactose transporter subunit IIC [Erysipelothrix larvae]